MLVDRGGLVRGLVDAGRRLQAVPTKMSRSRFVRPWSDHNFIFPTQSKCHKIVAHIASCEIKCIVDETRRRCTA